MVVLDEAVSALDVSMRAQLLDLLAEPDETLRTSDVFIILDLSVTHHVNGHILVMKVVEAAQFGDVEQVFDSPAHPHIQELLGSLEMPTAPRWSKIGLYPAS